MIYNRRVPKQRCEHTIHISVVLTVQNSLHADADQRYQQSRCIWRKYTRMDSIQTALHVNCYFAVDMQSECSLCNYEPNLIR